MNLADLPVDGRKASAGKQGHTRQELDRFRQSRKEAIKVKTNTAACPKGGRIERYRKFRFREPLKGY